jgi:hypothetical protein
MNPKLSLVLVTSLWLLSSVDVLAQAVSPLPSRLHCQNIPGVRDDIVGGSGRALIAGGYSCRVEGGPMSGGITTGSSIGEANGDTFVGFSGGSVTRKPGSLLVAMHGEFSSKTLRDADGKVKDVQGTGRGRYVLATGDATPFSGKGYRYVTRVTGPGMFDVDVTPE